MGLFKLGTRPNQQMENQSRPSLAMFISDDKISSTNIDEFLASFDPDKYRIFHDPRYKFLPRACPQFNLA
ncbi:hypothetical protein FOG08_12460 [Neisseria meningitidis]|nr:hypothetical protein [Neisseria meningitidis]